MERAAVMSFSLNAMTPPGRTRLAERSDRVG
jgi:hypothetical protein